MNYRYIFLTLMLTNILHTSSLDIGASSITYSDGKKNLHLKGNVQISDATTSLKADEALIKLDEKGDLDFYKAKGQITFKHTTPDRSYLIKASTTQFDARKQTFLLTGIVALEDNLTGSIKANRITINTATNHLEIVGTKAPVQLQIKLPKAKTP